MTQLTLNVKISNTTKITSFYANFERKSNLFKKLRNQVSTKATITKENTIKEIQKNVRKMQTNSTTYQNKKRKKAPLLKEGDKIYLFTKNLKINKRRSKKLNHVKVGPFFIKKAKGRVNYELNLLIDVKIFLVFHIFMLKSTHSNTSIQITLRCRSQEDQEYEVERILKQRGQQYLIKWKGYFTSKNTWESRENLINCSKELKKFHKANQETWEINHSKCLIKPLASTECRWWALMIKRHAPLDLTLQCFAASHSSSFVARFQQISIVESSVVASQSLREASLLVSCVALQDVDIDLCRERPNYKYGRDECIRGTCPNHRRSCMPFLGENSESRDASQEHRYQELPISYTYVETTFSFVWAWFMIRKERRFLETRKFEEKPNVTSTLRRDWAHHSTAYLWYRKGAQGAQGIEQIEQTNAQGAQGIEQVEQTNAQSA